MRHRRLPRGVRRLLGAYVTLLALFAAALCQGQVWPQPSGERTASKGGAEVDYSHAEDGYMMVRQEAGDSRYKLRVEKGGETYTYDLNSQGEWEVFPLQLGAGKYSVKVYRQLSGNRYTQAAGFSIPVEAFSDENAPFLCPNQYVDYTPDGQVAALSQELCQGLAEDAQKVQAVTDWVTANIMYDYVLALTVESGYLPDLEQLLTKRLGICFDYASLTAALLRYQGIPAKLVIGYADNTYHAWNEIYVNGGWVRLDTTALTTQMRVKAYTTERFY